MLKVRVLPAELLEKVRNCRTNQLTENPGRESAWGSCVQASICKRLGRGGQAARVREMGLNMAALSDGCWGREFSGSPFNRPHPVNNPVASDPGDNDPRGGSVEAKARGWVLYAFGVLCFFLSLMFSRPGCLLKAVSDGPLHGSANAQPIRARGT